MRGGLLVGRQDQDRLLELRPGDVRSGLGQGDTGMTTTIQAHQKADLIQVERILSDDIKTRPIDEERVEELVQSFRSKGQQQKIKVRPKGFWEVLGCWAKIISLCNVGCWESDAYPDRPRLKYSLSLFLGRGPYFARKERTTMNVASIVKTKAFWVVAKAEDPIKSEKRVLTNPATRMPMRNPTKSHQSLSNFVPYSFVDASLVNWTLFVNHPCRSSPTAYVMTIASVRITTFKLPTCHIRRRKTTRTPIASTVRPLFFVCRLTNLGQFDRLTSACSQLTLCPACVLNQGQPLILALDFDSCSVCWSLSVQGFVGSHEVVINLQALQDGRVYRLDAPHRFFSVPNLPVHPFHQIIVDALLSVQPDILGCAGSIGLPSETPF